MPSKTKVAAGSEIAFANALTGLFRDGAAYPLTIRYPNGAVALTYAPAAASSSSVATFMASASDAAHTSPVSGDAMPDAYAKAHISDEKYAAAKSAVAQTAASGRSRSLPLAGLSGGAEGNRFAAQDTVQKNIQKADAKSATVSAGFSLSSRILFAGAAGLSVLGAIGFFMLKNFLM